MPAVALGYLIFGVFVAITQLAALAGGLLAVDCAACFAVARLFDRERLITGSRSSRGIPAQAPPPDIRSPGEVDSPQ